LTSEPEDLCFAPPVRVGRALARERLPSCREPTSRNPQAMQAELFRGSTRTRTVSPSAYPCPASGGAANFFLASALSFHQQVLRPPGGEDARCVQPTSATQTNYVHPHLVCSQILAPLSRRGGPRRIRLRAALPGYRMFHDIRGRFGGSSFSAKSHALLPRGLES
jgi:hypothetical protein